MKNCLRLLAVALALVMVLLTAHKPSAAHEATHEVRGQIVKVTDGDTVTLLNESNISITIRLAGIDASELRMLYGQVAQAYLRDLVLNKVVIAKTHKQDRFGRTVATLWVNSEDINLAMIHAGMAWHYKKYQTDQPKQQTAIYDKSEQAARTEMRGLWQQQNPTPPWFWRKFRLQKDGQMNQVNDIKYSVYTNLTNTKQTRDEHHATLVSPAFYLI
jgi:endonuclease YncB( thermonuclease family)